MLTRIEREVGHALVVREADLRALWGELGKVYERAKITAQCSDGSQLEAAELEEVLTFDNRGPRHLTTLAFHFGAPRPSRETLSVSFLGKSTLNALVLVAAESEAEARQRAALCVGALRAMRPRWSLLSRPQLGWALSVLAWVVGFPRTLGALQGSGAPLTASLELGFAGWSGIFGVGVAAVVGSALVLQKVQGWLFPGLFFYIGAQQREWARRARGRGVFFGAVLLGLLATLAASFG